MVRVISTALSIIALSAVTIQVLAADRSQHPRLDSRRLASLARPLPERLIPRPDSHVPLVAEVLPGAVQAGQDVVVRVHGLPNAHLSIEAEDVGLSQLINLLPTDADPLGRAIWHFRIDPAYRADCLPIIISEQSPGSLQRVTLNLPVIHQRRLVPRLPLAFVSMPGTARRGMRISLTLYTAPKAKVRLHVPGAGFAQASSLMDRTADKRGLITWDWQVSHDYQANIMPVVATAEYRGAQTKMVGEIKVLP